MALQFYCLEMIPLAPKLKPDGLHRGNSKAGHTHSTLNAQIKYTENRETQGFSQSLYIILAVTSKNGRGEIKCDV